MTQRVVVWEWDSARRSEMARLVREAGFEPVEAASAEQALVEMAGETAGVLLVGATAWPNYPCKLLREAAFGSHEGATIVIVDAEAERVECERLRAEGVTDLLVWPSNAVDVRIRVLGALEKARLLQENSALRATIDERIAAGSRKYEELFLASLQTLADALEVKDAYTWGHSIRVSEYAMAIARELELPAAMMEQIEFGSRLHDIGKIGVREAVLNKRGPLTEEEYAHVMAHPVIGWKLLEPLLRDMPHALAVVRWHHERIDGRGVPDRLHGAQIPIEARVTAVADSFDAMTSGRPYQAGVSVEVALAELWRCAGTQFCAECVAAFERALERGAIDRPDWPVQRPLRAVRIVA